MWLLQRSLTGCLERMEGKDPARERRVRRSSLELGKGGGVGGWALNFHLLKLFFHFLPVGLKGNLSLLFVFLPFLILPGVLSKWKMTIAMMDIFGLFCNLPVGITGKGGRGVGLTRRGFSTSFRVLGIFGICILRSPSVAPMIVVFPPHLTFAFSGFDGSFAPARPKRLEEVLFFLRVFWSWKRGCYFTLSFMWTMQTLVMLAKQVFLGPALQERTRSLPAVLPFFPGFFVVFV